MLIQTNQVVDLSKVKRLTENHLTIHKQSHNKEHDPIMYGDKFPYGTASEPTLVDRKDIKWRGGKFQTYQSRFGNGNPFDSKFNTFVFFANVFLAIIFSFFFCCFKLNIQDINNIKYLIIL